MGRVKRVWVKQEKRIVKLLYKKGLLEHFELKDLYWAKYRSYKRPKRKSRKYKYAFTQYLPEVHFSSVDYWGECDEHGLVDHMIEIIYWKDVDPEDIGLYMGNYPKAKYTQKNRPKFIKYLESLPTVINDSKINEILKSSNNWD